ncbi:potassium channel subfamily K member 16-like isoform X2 [Syngnathoides biaculeatus]|uniref:potassium channel subfamily K member 16-like isoform X2 n=1 Tax=Syngnathoides biaculeatus TaxID=300417 RepID=UPI002ADE721C|nr:potassium channel subfamily K member 16-like isoform X2 [Syngnathoides biaculeatus]
MLNLFFNSKPQSAHRQMCPSWLRGKFLMAGIQLVRVKVSWTVLLALAHLTYLLFGAIIFQILEREAESNNRNHFQLEKLNFLANYTCLDGQALEKFVQVILDAWERGVNPSGNSTNPSNWDFSSAFFFAGTVVTTIGYGNLSPSTVSGQVFCVFYALCGIPLNLAFLKQLGKCLTIHLGRLERGMVAVVPHKQIVEALAVSSFFVAGSLLFLVVPPLLFSYVEGWTFGEGFYFAFITLSTIGFGDYVGPTQTRSTSPCIVAWQVSGSSLLWPGLRLSSAWDRE